MRLGDQLTQILNEIAERDRLIGWHLSDLRRDPQWRNFAYLTPEAEARADYDIEHGLGDYRVEQIRG